MRVSKWKVLGIAGALVLSYAVTSDAAQIKVSDETFADLGYWMKVRYVNLDERLDDHWNANVFDVVDARFNIEGQINKVFQFYGEVVTAGAYGEGVYNTIANTLGFGYPIAGRNTNAILSEGGINLVFLPELQLRLGKIRIPFTRDQQEARYSYIIQSDWIYDPQGFFRPLVGLPNGPLRLFDGGANLHGEIMGGVIRYDLGVFNEATSDEPLEDVAWVARLEFSPPILGFKPETKTTGRGWLHDTYLGRRGDVLTIGLSYFTQDYVDPRMRLVLIDDIPQLVTDPKEVDTDGYNIDLFLEKKLGSVLLTLEGAYVWMNDAPVFASPFLRVGTAAIIDTNDMRYWYIQGNLLYDCVVGIGKPALYAKYEYINQDIEIPGLIDDEISMYRVGVGVNYYVKGNAARLTVGVDWVRYDDLAEDVLDAVGAEDNITDFYVQAQIMF